MFGGFRASINFLGKKSNKSYDLTPDLGVVGAYRSQREDIFGNNPQKPPTKQITQAPQIRPTKSTSDLTTTQPIIPNLRNTTSISEISTDPRGAVQNNNNIATSTPKPPSRTSKKAEKQRAAEQKARQKAAAAEQAKQEKLRKEKEKRDAKIAKENRDRKGKKPAPQPESTNPLAQLPHSTNTLGSSISQSSGPPPYTEVPEQPKDKTGNVTYKKPVDEGSWDMITQHRQQITRPVTGPTKQSKQMVMDLNYSFGDAQNKEINGDRKENSEV